MIVEWVEYFGGWVSVVVWVCFVVCVLWLDVWFVILYCVVFGGL